MKFAVFHFVHKRFSHVFESALRKRGGNIIENRSNRFFFLVKKVRRLRLKLTRVKIFSIIYIILIYMIK